MRQKEKVYLTEELLIGRGTNKDVYIHPDNPARCIRINARSKDDHNQEMNYRKSRELRHLPQASLFVEYYGSVETNFGEGFVFERVLDYNGFTSKTIDDFIRLDIKAREEGKKVKAFLESDKEMPSVAEILFQLRRVIIEENVVVHDMRPENCMVQFDTQKNYRIRIIDGLGSPTRVPVSYYIDFFAAGHVRREWKRFIKRITETYPEFLTDEECRCLMVAK